MSTVVLYYWCHSDGASVLLIFFYIFVTSSHCRVELAVQFLARGSTQLLLSLFPGVLWLWHYLYSIGPRPVSSLHIYIYIYIYTLKLCRGHSWRVRLAKQETLTPPGHLVSPLVCRDPWMSTVVLYCWYHSDSASFLLYFTFLSHSFPLPCGAGSTVPPWLKCYYTFFLVCCGCNTSYIVMVHAKCRASIYIYTFWYVAVIHGGCG